MYQSRNAVNTIMFQNGVVTGAAHSLPQIPMGSHSKNVNESPKRPSKLSVCLPKPIQGNSEDTDGELSPTHSVDELDVTGRPVGDEAALDSDTRQLLSSFMAEFTGTRRGHWKESPALVTMKRVVGNLMEKHRYVYNGRWPGFVWTGTKGGGQP